MIVYEKGDLVFIFNFHPSKSFESYTIGTWWKSDHYIVLDSDEERFGGYQRLDSAHDKWFEVINEKCNDRPYSIKLYAPCRTCIVLCPYEHAVDVEGVPIVTDRQRD